MYKVNVTIRRGGIVLVQETTATFRIEDGIPLLDLDRWQIHPTDFIDMPESGPPMPRYEVELSRRDVVVEGRGLITKLDVSGGVTMELALNLKLADIEAAWK